LDDNSNSKNPNQYAQIETNTLVCRSPSASSEHPSQW
jgi:hypothetical protein